MTMALPILIRAVRLILVGSLALPAVAAAQEKPEHEAEAQIVTAPVILDDQTLFELRGVSSLPASERARRISQRLAVVAADRNIPLDSLQIIDRDGASRIQAGDYLIMGIIDADARFEQVQRSELATAHLVRIQQALAVYRDARSPAALRRAVRDALVATLLFALALVVIRWLWSRIDHALGVHLRQRIHSLEIQSFEVMRAESIWDALRSTVAAIRAFALAMIVLIYVGYVLALFPRTRGLSRNMGELALGPLVVIGSGVVRHLPSLAFLVVLFLVFRVVIRLLKLFFEAVGREGVKLHGFDAEWAQPTYKVVRLLLVAFGVVVAYPYIPGSQSAAFQGVSLFLGVVFSLGSSTAIANIIAGYMLIYRRAFRVGDRIRVGETVGDVVSMRLQVTHLRSVKNEEIILPNSHIIGAEVLNYSSLGCAQGLILHTDVGIGYETPWQQVEAMLVEAAQRTEGLGTDPRPFILEKKLGDFAVTYELNVYCTNVPQMGFLYAQLHRHILDVFNEYGVQIMTPAYEGDPEEPKLVPPDNWYPPPAVRRPPEQGR